MRGNVTGENLFVVLPVMAPTSQELEPPTKPGRFRAIDSNNGYRQYVSASANHLGGTITVNYNGNGVAEAFYQSAPFRASDDVKILYPKFEMNAYVALFICALILREKYRFNYGRKWHLGRMQEAIMRLPVTSKGEPDWTSSRPT